MHNWISNGLHMLHLVFVLPCKPRLARAKRRERWSTQTTLPRRGLRFLSRDNTRGDRKANFDDNIDELINGDKKKRNKDLKCEIRLSEMKRSKFDSRDTRSYIHFKSWNIETHIIEHLFILVTYDEITQNWFTSKWISNWLHSFTVNSLRISIICP